MHDFRVVIGPTHTNLIFDIVLPFRLSERSDEIRKQICNEVSTRIGATYFCVIDVDYKISPTE